MLASGCAAFGDHELIYFWSEVEDDLAVFFFGEVHERNDVEVAIAHVARDGVDEVRCVFGKQGV